MYIPTKLYEFSFILHVESMAKTVIKGTISQLSLGNFSSQTLSVCKYTDTFLFV